MAFLQELEERTFDQLVTDFDGEIPGVRQDLGDVFFQEVAWELRRRDPERAAPVLLARLPRADPARVSAALLALSADGERDRQYIPTLRTELDHPSPSVQSAAIDGLRVLRDVDSAPIIEPLADSPDPAVRAAALRFLAGTEHPDALRRLRAAFTVRTYRTCGRTRLTSSFRSPGLGAAAGSRRSRTIPPRSCGGPPQKRSRPTTAGRILPARSIRREEIRRRRAGQRPSRRRLFVRWVVIMSIGQSHQASSSERSDVVFGVATPDDRGRVAAHDRVVRNIRVTTAAAEIIAP